MSLDLYDFSPNVNFPIAVGLGMLRGFSTSTITAVANEVPLVRTDTTNIGAYTFPSDSGEALELIGEVGDTTDITVWGMDENGESKDDTKTLNGTTPVPLDGLWSRVNFSRNVGAVDTIGDVDVRQSGGGNIFSRVLLEAQTSTDGVFSVPKNKRIMVMGVIPTMRKNTGSNTSITVFLQARTRGGVFITPFAVGLQRDGDTSPEFLNDLPVAWPALTDVKIQAFAAATGSDLLVRMTMLIVDDEKV